MTDTYVSNTSIKYFENDLYRAWNGLKLALKDPKVYIFAIFDFCTLLGFGFISFFPTSVIPTLFLLVVLTLFLKSGCNNGLHNHYHTVTCSVRCLSTLTFT